MSKSIKLKDSTYWDSSSIVHNKIPLSNLLNKYVVNSDNFVVTPSVDITKDYTGSGNYLQLEIPINSPWGGKTLDKTRYFKLRVFYIQNSNYTYPWRDVVIGSIQGGDSWSKRLYISSGNITKGTDYNVYEATFSYSATDKQNPWLRFIWEHSGCGCTIKYIEFYEVIPLFL